MDQTSVSDRPFPRNPLACLFAAMWRYSQGNRKKVCFFWFLFLIAELNGLFLTAFIWAHIMDIVQRQGVTEANFLTLLGLLFLTWVCRIAFWACHGPARVMEINNSFQVRKRYREFLLRGILTLPMQWHKSHHSGDTIDKLNKGADALNDFSAESSDMIYSAIKLVGSFLVLAHFTMHGAAIAILILMINIWIIAKFDAVLVVQYKQLSHAENQIAERIFDTISGISTVIILRAEKLVYDALVAKMEEPYALQARNNIVNETKWFLTSMCCNALYISVAGLYLWESIGLSKTALVINVFLLTKYLDTLTDLCFIFTDKYGQVLRRKAKVANAQELAEQFIDETLTNHVLPSDWNTIEVGPMEFAYASRDEQGACR